MPLFVRALMLLGFFAGGVNPNPVAAEFYSRTDSRGERHISNIPYPGVDANGHVRRGYHPYSVSAQHARMRENLERQAADIAAANARATEAHGRGESLSPRPLFDALSLPASPK